MGKAREYTAAEIAEIREIYARWKAIRLERIRFTKSRGLRPDQFNRVGSGRIGKRLLRGMRA
ncbi:MAG: hypothetical protein RL671_174 [Pseudomonadota bacterium]|jgi:hypothetical protein